MSAERSRFQKLNCANFYLFDNAGVFLTQAARVKTFPTLHFSNSFFGSFKLLLNRNLESISVDGHATLRGVFYSGHSMNPASARVAEGDQVKLEEKKLWREIGVIK